MARAKKTKAKKGGAKKYHDIKPAKDVIKISTGNPKAIIREDHSNPLGILKVHILKAKELFGHSLEAVYISTDYHSKIIKPFKDNLINASINGIEL